VANLTRAIALASEAGQWAVVAALVAQLDSMRG